MRFMHNKGHDYILVTCSKKGVCTLHAVTLGVSILRRKIVVTACTLSSPYY